VQTSLRRLGLLTIAGSLSLTALLAIVVLLTADFNRGSVNILATTALVALFSLLALPGGVLLDRGRNRRLAWTSLGLALLAFLLLEGQLWEAGPGWRPTGLAVIWAFALAEIAMLEARRREGESQAASIAFWAAGTLAVVIALILSAAVLDVVHGVAEGAALRVLGVAAVANILLVLLQPILRRLGEEPAAPAREHRFVVAVDALPSTPPTERGYWLRSNGAKEIECALPGRDFASAVAEAIRTLERSGARVERVERIG
jgi:MFS family permease